MRPTPWVAVEQYRIQPPDPGYRSRYGDAYGVFIIRGPVGKDLRVIATDGDYVAARLPPEYAWEHVSVSVQNRCPNWPEMAYVKSLFWRDDETVMQLHVSSKDHVNHHPYCLHLWRPVNQEIPLPPPDTVGPTRSDTAGE